MWSTVLRKCTHIQNVTLVFPDESVWMFVDYARAIIRMAANIADVKKRTGEPVMAVKAFMGDPTLRHVIGGQAGSTAIQIRQMMRTKKHPKMQVPRGIVIELMGKMSVAGYTLLQSYTRKEWSFRRKTPLNACNVVDGAWVELEWVKSQHGAAEGSH